MKHIINLGCWECRVQNKIYNLLQYLFVFFLFSTLSMVFVSPRFEIFRSGALLCIVYIPLSLIGFSKFVFKQDIEDGSLDFLLSNFTIAEIITGKFLSLLINSVLAVIFKLPILYIFFNLKLKDLSLLTVILLLLLFSASALTILIGAVQAYFRSNTNIISILIMVLLLPNIILSGLIFQHSNIVNLLSMILGMNCIMVPISLILAGYLIKNIYNS